MKEENSLVIFTRASQMLAEANTIQKTKELMDLALTAMDWAKRKKMGKDSEDMCRSYAIEAEKKMGQMLRDSELQHGARGIGKSGVPKENPTPTLKELGITKKDSSRAQKLTELSDSILEEIKVGKKSVSKAITEFKKEEDKDNRKKVLSEIKKENFKLPDFVTIEHGDCLALSKSIKDNSISLIVTDPPYPEEFIDCWTKLGKIAFRTLEPSGFCVAYSGQMHLPEVINRVTKEGMLYYWTFTLIHTGPSSTIHPRSIMNGFKPILIFQKPPLKKLNTYISDVIQGSGKEKGSHIWQQGEAELKQIFDGFYNKGTVLEPYAGSGTTLHYCKSQGIKCVGYELDELAYKSCLKRLGD